ncbi:hypothetical protein YC2023_074341 [Brassica napus]
MSEDLLDLWISATFINEYRAHPKGDVRAEDEAVVFHSVVRREVRDIAVVDRRLISSQIDSVSQIGDRLIENGGGSQTGFVSRWFREAKEREKLRDGRIGFCHESPDGGGLKVFDLPFRIFVK